VINGTPPTQQLVCTAGDFPDEPGGIPIRAFSNTDSTSCGTYANTAQASATNATSENSNPATVRVLCPGLNGQVTADNGTIFDGSQIGFGSQVENTGTQTGANVTGV
jgi:hypothetical protein